MKPIQKILFAVVMTVSVFSAALYTSCKKSKCHNVTCLNRGNCDNGRCICPIGFEGNRCQVLMRDKFLFRYNGGDSCQGTPFANHFTQYSVTLVADMNDSLEMTLTNLLNDMADSATCTIQSADSFTFIGSNNSTTFTGVGKLRNDSLWLAYHVVHDTSSYDCKYFGQSLR